LRNITQLFESKLLTDPMKVC